MLARMPSGEPPLPLDLPSPAQWLVRVLARHGRFVVGVHRRRMKVIGELDRLKDIFGVSVTVRSLSTMRAIGRVLDRSGAASP